MSDIKAFKALNEELKKEFGNNICFRLIKEGKLNESHAGRFLACYQIFSTAFQKAIFVRGAFCDDPYFAKTFKQHLIEEFGHDDLLLEDRMSLEPVSLKKDAILSALTTWLVYKVQSSNHYEQAVLLNVCIESAAPVIYFYTKPCFDPNNRLTHFKAHEGDVDDGHLQMGFNLLEGLSKEQFKKLEETLRESWAMLNALMKRMAELSLNADS